MKKIILFSMLLFPILGWSQIWIDTLYTIQDTTVSYGTVTDFAGNQRLLEMDISYPTNDVPPNCGRPVMLLIHGGAFMAGSKADANIVRMRKDFAKRGYITAAINYRLGMFQVPGDWHCNITYFDGVEWDCLNQSDTLEWYRAYYRGIQDARGALRYLAMHDMDYQLSRDNIFVTGESAGAFIAMGVGFLDDNSEQPAGTGARANAPVPNVRYESLCVQGYNLDTNIASMNLARPDLGGIEGDLNLGAPAYRIRGVGDFFGGMFSNLFATNANDAKIPALYIFHQPADLIVPHQYKKLFTGYSFCANQFPWNCAGILNRPYTHGGLAIRGLIDTLAANGQAVPDYLAEITTNNADCNTQIGNPSLGGHQMDNYWTRTVNMATFFAGKIDTVCVTGIADQNFDKIRIYPNPNQGSFNVTASTTIESVEIHDTFGRKVFVSEAKSLEIELKLPESLARGVYFVRIQTQNGFSSRRLILQ